jgi:hypothetical protein
MSFAMAPKASFIELLKVLLNDYDILCQPHKPLWACTNITPESYMRLPNLRFSLITESGSIEEFYLPKEGYIKLERD